VFFALLREGRIDAATISDYNESLMITLAAIERNVEAVMALLNTSIFMDNQECYNNVRSWDRDESWNKFLKDPDNYVWIASRFIYLNRTTRMGMYRVNQAGQANMPYFAQKDRRIVFEENLRAVSEALKGIIVGKASFEYIQSANWDYLAQQMNPICPTDFFYFDPPYVGTFTGYTKNGFNMEDLERLKVVCNDLTNLGSFVMISMTDSTEVRELFKGYQIVDVETYDGASVRGGKKLSKKKELIIMNYDENDKILPYEVVIV